MNILVACEFSGRVRDAFRRRGHQATSCDLLPSDVDGPHLQLDVREVDLTPYDLLIAHPPCTYLAASGARWWKDRQKEQAEAIEFVRWLAEAPMPRIAIENPVGRLSSVWRKPDQIIQPWMFGHREAKATCLWLKGLPCLVSTVVVHPTLYACACGTKFNTALGKYGCPNCQGDKPVRLIFDNQTPSGQNTLGPSPDRWKLRSVTYEGIAEAMAEQWGNNF